MKMCKILTPMSFLFLFASVAIEAYGRNKEAVEETLVLRLQSIESLNAESARQQHLEVETELRQVFQDAILSQPKMSQKEIDALYADYIEDNLELFVEQHLLRLHALRMRKSGGTARAFSVEQARSIEAEYKDRVQELREQSIPVIERTLQP